MAKKKLKKLNYDRMVVEVAKLVDGGKSHFEAQKAVEKRKRLNPGQIRIFEAKYLHQVCLAT